MGNSKKINNNNIFNIRIEFVISLLLILMTIIPYSRVAKYPFVFFDDMIYVYENPVVRSGLTIDGIKWAFQLRNNERTYWHPVTWLSHMIDAELFGMNAGAHHLSNVFFHILNVILLFYILFSITGMPWKSAFVAAIFALHPMNTESVAWMAERKNVLSTFFWMLTTVAYIKYVKQPGVKKYFITLVLFITGLMAKPMLVTLPFVFLLMDYWPLERVKFYAAEIPSAERIHAHSSKYFVNRSMGMLILEKLPFIILSLGSSYLSSLSLKYAGNVTSFEKVPIILRISNALVSYIKYLWKLIYPFDLSVFYPYPKSIPLWQVTGAILLLFCITCLVVLGAYKGKKYLVTGWLWYAGTLFPAIGIMQAGLWPELADRWIYVPSIGLFVIFAWGIDDIIPKFSQRRAVVACLALIFLVFNSSLTGLQLRHWKSTKALWAQAVAVDGNNHIAQENFGIALIKEEGNYDKAMKHFKSAIKIFPRNKVAFTGLATCFLNMDNVDEAISYYSKALSVDHKYKEAHVGMAAVLIKKKELEKAKEHLEIALNIDSELKEAHYNMGVILTYNGNYTLALQHYSHALRIDPDFEKVYNKLGIIAMDQGKIVQAMELFNEALRIDNDFEEARENLNKCLALENLTIKEIAELLIALRDDPENVELHHRLGKMYQQAGKLNDAIDHYQKAVDIKSDYIPALMDMALVYAFKGNYSEALSKLQSVVKIRPNFSEAYYHLAGIHAKKNKIEESLDWFEKAIENGFNDWELIKSDKNMENIRSTKKFSEIMKRIVQ